MSSRYIRTPLARSSSRLGHGPLKAGARVRVPYALPINNAGSAVIADNAGNELEKEFEELLGSKEWIGRRLVVLNPRGLAWQASLQQM